VSQPHPLRSQKSEGWITTEEVWGGLLREDALGGRANAMKTHEAMGGLKASLKKRKPAWKGN
jgi:hypothetical protein